MRVLFMGTSNFAVPTLRALIASRHEVIGVVTQPDRPSGRGLGLTFSPVKTVALDMGLSIFQPEKVSSPDFVETVRALSPDVIVVAAFGQILSQDLLEIPRYGCLNVHASLLPKYRGAAPVSHALFDGETRTGVTIMLMDAGLDTGPILLQREVEIMPEDNQGTLESRLADLGANLLVEALDRLEEGTITPVPQDDSLATKAPSLKREQCQIDWTKPATRIVNLVRGCTPRPGAYTWWKGKELRVWQCRVCDNTPGASPGEIVSVGKDGIVVASGAGSVLLEEVQPENRKRMTAADFARGQHITPGMHFSSEPG